MTVNIHIHHHLENESLIIQKLDKIMGTQANLAQQIRDLTAQNEKATAEQLAAMKKLQDALDAAGNTTPEVDAAMADLKASIQRDDDLNPDEPPTTEG